MASEIKVDTVSEKTSANGVTIDGVALKDGAVTATGIVTGTAFTAGSAVLAEAELELLDGLTAGTAIASKVVTTDASIDTTGMRNLTISGELDAATLDISGAIDIAGASVLHGLLTHDGGAVFNEASADVDFRVEGNGDSNLMIIDGGADNVSFSRGSAATDQAIVHISRGGYNPGTSGKHALMVGANIGDANTLTNNNRKFGSIVVPHYTNAEEPITIANIDSDNGASTMYLGGYSTTNSVENIVLRTASDDADKSTGADRMIINSAGQLLVGTTATFGNANGMTYLKQPTADKNNVYIGVATDGVEGIAFYNAASAGQGGVTVNTSGVTFNTSSDYRLKENVDYDFDATTRLKQLKPARFNWIVDEDNTLVDGFLAHEVSSIIPEAISGEKDAMHPEVLYTADDELPEGKEIGDVKEVTKPNYQGIDQSKLVPLLVKSLQEAITKIETLETKVTALENA